MVNVIQTIFDLVVEPNETTLLKVHTKRHNPPFIEHTENHSKHLQNIYKPKTASSFKLQLRQPNEHCPIFSRFISNGELPTNEWL